MIAVDERRQASTSGCAWLASCLTRPNTPIDRRRQEGIAQRASAECPQGNALRTLHRRSVPPLDETTSLLARISWPVSTSSFRGSGSVRAAASPVGSAVVGERDRRVVVERQHVRVDHSICIRSGHHRLDVGAFREALSRLAVLQLRGWERQSVVVCRRG